MKKSIIPVLLIMGWWLAGCAPTTYQVKVNGYTEPNVTEQIAPGDSFLVMGNKEAPNPLLDKEIREKIIKLLEQQGYQISSLEQAKYYLLFTYGIGSGREASAGLPSYPLELQTLPGPKRRADFIAGSYPQPNVYDKRLQLKVVDGKYYRENKGQFRTLWVGEAGTAGISSDLRAVVNYLLTAVFQQFGKNTGKALPVEIEAGDVRVMALGN